jgi:hypothetical protein
MASDISHALVEADSTPQSLTRHVGVTAVIASKPSR